MSKPIIVVTGANGQLGKEIGVLSGSYPAFDFLFLSRAALPVDDAVAVDRYFEQHKPAYCINCAAYTAVDKAETEKDLAMLVNGEAVGVLAAACHRSDTKFIHISTDYVFDGMSTVPYRETDATNPVNFYGSTKLKGEEESLAKNPSSLIIRTSWVYSEFGNNFVKTMIRLMKERDSLNVVNDQLGSPTYARDLAGAILTIISRSELRSADWVPGIYHYSNEGVISWHAFAQAIKEITGSACTVNGIPTSGYPTPAKRPAYSVFNKEKIKSVYHITPPVWRESLMACIARL
jgi:dTDP-4-dehydrorhamnose reductase